MFFLMIRKFQDKIIFILSAILFVAVCYKSAVTSFTHDESITYLHYVKMDYASIVAYNEPYTNNHILNTILMKIAATLFGAQEWALRIPNLIALLVYLFFAYKLVKKIIPTFYLPGFILLLANPYLIDFFGLARGYGLSISCMIMCIYYFLCAIESSKWQDILLFNLAAMLAIYSNFALIDFYVAVLVIYNVFLLNSYISSGKRFTVSVFFRKNAINISFAIATTLILWEPIRKISGPHMLDFGGKSGLVANTISSLITSALYNISLPAIFVVCASWLLFTLIIITFLFWIVQYMKQGARMLIKYRYLISINSILLIIFSEMEIQHIVLGTDFFIERFALFLFPLFIIQVLLLLQLLIASKINIVGSILQTVLVICLVVNTLFNMNLSYYRDWKYDIDTKKVMLIMKRHYLNHPHNAQVTLGVYWYFEPSTNFYKDTWALSWLQPVERRDLTVKDNYYYSYRNELLNVDAPMSRTLYYSEQTSAYLVYNQ